MNEERKGRLIEVAKPIGEIFLLGGLYFLFVQITGWSIPCPFKLVTGKYCPGCGLTRMILALVRFDFEGAFWANPLLFCLLPFVLVYMLIKDIYYIKMGKRKQSKLEGAAVLILFVLTVAFWIMRNMQRFSFLAPV